MSTEQSLAFFIYIVGKAKKMNGCAAKHGMRKARLCI